MYGKHVSTSKLPAKCKNSRIGKKPIVIPKKVDVTIDGNQVKVKGPKGELQRTILDAVIVRKEDDKLFVEQNLERFDRSSRAFHGLMRTLISNMVEGVDKASVSNL